jgi:Ca2+-binding RTX toxin-like protein
VTITNTGSASGTLSLSSFDRSDSPGTYGGALSGQLELLLSDVTNGPGKTVYAGALTAMPELNLGILAGGEARTYRFAVTMYNGGAPASPFVGDNLYQRATTGISYQWKLTETEGSEPPPEPPVPPPVAPSQPAAPASPQPLQTKLVGTSGPDRLIGTPEDDVIYGRGGADMIRGLAGDDKLFGGAGRDRIKGGRGSDLIMARDGTPDVIDCGGGRDKAYVDVTDRASNCEQVLGPRRRKRA